MLTDVACVSNMLHPQTKPTEWDVTSSPAHDGPSELFFLKATVLKPSSVKQTQHDVT